jgi:uncharacterized cupredoxin-like copper-binding protein
MTRLTIVVTFAVLSATNAMPATAGSEPAEHSHEMEGFSVGEPGDPKELSRIIQVTMEERDGKMLYVPAQVEIREGETIKFVIYNNGELDHEFVLASTEENLEHAEMMMKNPEMQHADPNARRVAPKQASELVWKFTKPGQFEFACLIPGHRDAGMIGTVDVK